MTETLKEGWEEPGSLTDAEQRRLTLLEDIGRITKDLSDPVRRNKDGVRMHRAEYRKWRHQAVRALNHKQNDLRLTNAWIKEMHKEFDRKAKENLKPVWDAYRLLANLLEDVDDVTDDEKAVRDNFRNWLQPKMTESERDSL